MRSISIATDAKLQQGMGLVEVLVALLLLAVAALGYAALQARTLGSTDDAVVRSDAQLLLSETAGRLRTYAITRTVLNQYQTQLNATSIPRPLNCQINSCTINQMVSNDVAALRTRAAALDLKLGMVTCPGTLNAAQTVCLIAAWNQTNTTMGSNNSDCMKHNGAYHLNADCVYMESY